MSYFADPTAINLDTIIAKLKSLSKDHSILSR